MHHSSPRGAIYAAPDNQSDQATPAAPASPPQANTNVAPSETSPAAKPRAAGQSKMAAGPRKPKADTPSKKEKKEEHEPTDPDTGTSTLSGETLGLLPNPFEKHGIKFTLTYVADGLANVDGGLRRGVVYEGRLNAAVDLDLAKLVGITGLVFHANAFQSHGPRLSAQYIGNLMPVSSIEELATTRLYEAWFEQILERQLFRACRATGGGCRVHHG